MSAVNSILSHFSKADLLKIARQEGLKVDDKSSKGKILETICLEIEDVGIKQITAQMKKVDLEEMLDPLKIDHKSNAITKTVLRKRLIEAMESLGTEEFLKRHTNAELLVTIVKSLEVEPASTNSKDKLVAQVTGLVNLVGFQTFFSRFDTPFLVAMMEQLNLECETSSKQKIVYALATHTDAAKDDTRSKEVTYSKKKKPIAPGVSYQDIFQHYFREDIIEFCKENGLKVSGTKKELINRILAYFDGDKENTMAVANTKETTKETKVEKKVEKKPTKKVEKKVEVEEESASEPEPPKKETKKTVKKSEKKVEVEEESASEQEAPKKETKKNEKKKKEEQEEVSEASSTEEPAPKKNNKKKSNKTTKSPQKSKPSKNSDDE